MPTVIARKIGMTQIFSEDGTVKPVTVLRVPHHVVTELKTKKENGSKVAVIGAQISKKINKAQAAIQENIKSKEKVSNFFEVVNDKDFKAADNIDLGAFEVGEKVTVVGLSKGKGFAGTIKRHGFHRGPVSHGSKNVRQPGSIGAQQPQRVIKGKKMAGHMGVKQTTIKNLDIISINNDEIVLSGAVPGPNKSYVYIKKASQ